MAYETTIKDHGFIVREPTTGAFFVESPRHYYAVGNAELIDIHDGDAVEFEAVPGDKFADLLLVNGHLVS